MSTIRNAAAQIENSQSQTETQERRERLVLSQWRTNIMNKAGQVVGTGLELTSVSFLPENDEHKATYGGMLDGFLDAKTGRPCTFTSKTGEVINGKCPIRFFDTDAEALLGMVGEPRPGHRLQLVLTDEADAAVYRKDDDAVSFLALRMSAVRMFKWVPMVVEID